jgi:signal transduction histidine kinase
MTKPVILCVDDEKMILEALREQLIERFGDEYQIETAERGEEALELFKELLEEEIEVPVVIADCIMPEMKGDELLKQIYLLEPKVIKIMLTGQANKEEVINAVNHANLYHYLAKPWETEALILTVSEGIKSYFRDQQLELQNVALKEMNVVLKTKNDALTQLNQEKNEFLGIAAHDLKNPLSGIKSFSEYIQDFFDDLSKEDIINYVGIIHKSAIRMFDFISNLLDVNAIESGKMNISPKNLDILPSIQLLIRQNLQKAQAKNIHLSCQCVEKKYFAFVDENTVRQVLDNLISNALKYSPKGKNIIVRVSQDEQQVRCEIQDEGPGLSEADQKKLFGKFVRLSALPTDNEHSNGLGLFIVKKLVEAMNGKVWCESELGQGATFIVSFPASRVGRSETETHHHHTLASK